MFLPTRFALAMIAVATLVLPCAPAPDTALAPKADPRLAKTVTLYFAPTPLGELLQKLSQQTGITLNAPLPCIVRFWWCTTSPYTNACNGSPMPLDTPGRRWKPRANHQGTCCIKHRSRWRNSAHSSPNTSSCQGGYCKRH